MVGVVKQRQEHLTRDGKRWIDVARANGIKPTTFYVRINRDGWSAEDAATIPARPYTKSWPWST